MIENSRIEGFEPEITSFDDYSRDRFDVSFGADFLRSMYLLIEVDK